MTFDPTAHCQHVWTLFCLGTEGINRKPYIRTYWRVDICVHCYAKRQITP